MFLTHRKTSIEWKCPVIRGRSNLQRTREKQADPLRRGICYGSRKRDQRNFFREHSNSTHRVLVEPLSSRSSQKLYACSSSVGFREILYNQPSLPIHSTRSLRSSNTRCTLFSPLRIGMWRYYDDARSLVYPVTRFFLSLANASATGPSQTRSIGVQENIDATRLWGRLLTHPFAFSKMVKKAQRTGEVTRGRDSAPFRNRRDSTQITDLNT